MANDKDQVAQLEGQVTDLEAQVTELGKKLQKAMEDGGNAEAIALQQQVTDLTGQLEDMTKAMADVTDALESEADAPLQKVLLSLTPDELVVAKAMDAEDAKDGGDDEEAEGKKKKPFGKRLTKFLSMPADERAAHVADLSKKDDTVVIEGETIRKSVVGESTFKVMKAQAARLAKQEKDIELEKAARINAEFTKAADDKYAHVPGSVQERADMLIAIDKMAEPLKKSFLAVFEQSEKLAKGAFDTVGHAGGGSKQPGETKIAKAVSDFTAKAAEIGARDKLSKTAAFAKARKEHPDLFKAYQEAGAEEGKTAQ